MTMKLKQVIITAMVLTWMPLSGCLLKPKPHPPVAPCVYEVQIIHGDWYSYNDAEDDLHYTPNGVTFTDCWSGQRVLISGSFKVTRFGRRPPEGKGGR